MLSHKRIKKTGTRARNPGTKKRAERIIKNNYGKNFLSLLCVILCLFYVAFKEKFSY